MMDTPPPVPPPRQFAPGYRVVGRLRRGADSAIYRAVRDADQREIVLKVFHAESLPIAQAAAPLLALPAHPHIAQVLGHGRTDEGLPFLALAFHPGDSYEDRLGRSGAASVDEVVHVGAAVADALAVVHGAGLVHGDVTPGNILRAADGPVLTDFGLVAPAHEVAGTVALDRLTPHHAAPEVLLGRPATQLSDVYGLASTMWTMLAGYPPFATPGTSTIDPFEYREHAVHVPVPPVPRGDVPWWLQAVLRRAMAKSPGDRYPDAAGFGEALRNRRTPPDGPAAAPPVPVVHAGDADRGAAVHGSVLPHPGPAGLPAPPPPPEPVQPEPVTPEPAQSGPVAREAIQPGHVEPQPVQPGPVAPQPAAYEPFGSVAEAAPPQAEPYDPPTDPGPPFAPHQPEPYQPAMAHQWQVPVPQTRRRRARSWVDVRPSGGPPAPAAGDPLLFAPEPAAPPPRRRPGRRWGMVGSVAVTVMFAAALVAAVAIQLSLRPDPPAGTAPPPDAATTTAPAATQAPIGLEIADERVAVALSWEDPTDGQVPFTVIGGPAGDEPNISVSVGPGQTSTRIQALNPRVDYCFRVLAVVSVAADEIPASDEACTNRFSETGPPD